MIHQVAIKTLPQEWLWCETWCDDTSKRYAKTIDLVNANIVSLSIEIFQQCLFAILIHLRVFKQQCNNPMTKEAKLQAAVRILPEWVGYDEEIKVLQQKVENQNRQTEKEDQGTQIRAYRQNRRAFTCI